jgi:hypothetical protein
MRTNLEFVEMEGYLHVIVTGRNTREVVSEHLQEVLRESVGRGVKRVLVEERLVGPRLPMADVYELVSEGAQRAMGWFSALAFVDINAAATNHMDFAEDVAVNRGVPLMVFGTVAAAEAWMRQCVVQVSGWNGDNGECAALGA